MSERAVGGETYQYSPAERAVDEGARAFHVCRCCTMKPLILRTLNLAFLFCPCVTHVTLYSYTHVCFPVLFEYCKTFITVCFAMSG